MPDSSVPRARTPERVLAVLVGGPGRVAYSMISWSPMSLRAHWMIPMPMKSSAKPSAVPKATVEAPRPRTVSWLSPFSTVT